MYTLRYSALAQSAQTGWSTWSPSVALDFILVVRQLHRQAKVGDADVAYESKQEPKVTDAGEAVTPVESFKSQ